MKSVLQKLWLLKSDGVSLVPPSLEITWFEFEYSISNPNQSKIPRFVTPSDYHSKLSDFVMRPKMAVQQLSTFVYNQLASVIFICVKPNVR